jgi:hypothetical protein
VDIALQVVPPNNYRTTFRTSEKVKRVIPLKKKEKEKKKKGNVSS